MGVLPKNKSGISYQFPSNEIWLVAGPPRSGKTSFALSWPEPLWMLFDKKGMNYFEAYKYNPTSYPEVLVAIEELNNEIHPYKTIIIDTVDMLAQLITEYICKKRDINALRELEFGIGYDLQHQYVISVIHRIHEICVKKGMTLILLMHTKEGHGRSTTISLTETLSRYVSARSGIAAFSYKDKDSNSVKYWIDLTGSGVVEAGAVDPIINSLGEIPNKYDYLIMAYNTKLKEVFVSYKNIIIDFIKKYTTDNITEKEIFKFFSEKLNKIVTEINDLNNNDLKTILDVINRVKNNEQLNTKLIEKLNSLK